MFAHGCGVASMGVRVMSNRPVTAITAGLLLFATASQVAAGGKAVACYEKYRQPAVYETIYEKVQVRPAGQQVEVIPAIYGTQKRKVVISGERVSHRVIPAEYGAVREKVVIYPATTVKRVIPAVTRTEYRTVKVSDGGYSWEWQVIDGRKVLCKVKHKPVYQSVAQTVVEEPQRVVHETVPAEYGYESRTVLIAPERRERVVIPAEYGYVAEQVMIQPAQERVIAIPAEYQVVARRVLVSEGAAGWQKVRIPRHC